MAVEARISPAGVYRLRLSAGVGDATKRVADGVVTVTLGGADWARAWQSTDGTVIVRATSEEAVERMRFVLALDDDHTEFLLRFAGDPLLGPSLHALRGMRPARTATVSHALLRAVAGQLIEAKLARAIERRVIRDRMPLVAEGLYAPPLSADLASFAPVGLRRHGLATHRGSTLVRICRDLDVERLRGVPLAAAQARLLRERGLGPWSLGVVSMEGLGRFEHGIVGDLGLMKLCAALWGRWPEADETAELLAPYGEWAGLACAYRLTGWSRGLVPGANGAVARRARVRTRYAA
jgi:3-methyladenine DNA glycosylase/8-oxoguanine DNA glycosylase